MSYSGKLVGKYGGSMAGKPSIRPLSPLLDTRLPRPQRTIVQMAVVDMLARLHVDNGGYVLAIEPTSTVVKSAHDEQAIAVVFDQLAGRHPAILVATGDKPYQPVGTGRDWKAQLSVHVYLVGENLRSRMSRLVGDAQSYAAPNVADPGLYLMMEHVEQLLAANDPGATNGTIKELFPVTEEQLDGDNEMEIWHQVYSVMVTRSTKRKRDLDVELREISAYHHVTPQLQTDQPVVSTLTEIPKP